MTDEATSIMKRERICVIVPTYKNEGTIIDVLRRIKKITDDIIVVVDGCPHPTESLLAKVPLNVTVISYEENRGKGYALKTGFKKAILMGFEYAITIDSDGQHFPEDIPMLVSAFKKDNQALIVGARDFDHDNMPRGNTFANRFSNFWYYVQTGIRIEDTQTGFRLYPLSMLDESWIISPRYEGELQLLVYSAWRGVHIISVPVRVYYPPMSERVTHFRPFVDFARISLLNIFLCIGAITYFLPVKLIRELKNRK